MDGYLEKNINSKEECLARAENDNLAIFQVESQGGDGKWVTDSECFKEGRGPEECEYFDLTFAIGGGSAWSAGASSGVGRSRHRPPRSRRCSLPRFRWISRGGRRRCVRNRRRF